jgi:hypothetical protein
MRARTPFVRPYNTEAEINGCIRISGIGGGGGGDAPAFVLDWRLLPYQPLFCG